MKKLLTKVLLLVSCVLALVFALTGCFGGGEVTPQDMANTYKFSKYKTTYSENGILKSETVKVGDTVYGQKLTADFIVIEMKQDGTLTVTFDGKSDGGEWEQEEENSKNVVMDLASFGVCSGTCDGKTLTFVLDEGESSTTFTLKVAEKETPSASVTGIYKIQSMKVGNTTYRVGDEIDTGSPMGGTFVLSADYMVITLKEEGAASISATGATFNGSYTLSGKKIAIDFTSSVAGMEFSGTCSNSTLSLTQQGVQYVFTKTADLPEGGDSDVVAGEWEGTYKFSLFYTTQQGIQLVYYADNEYVGYGYLTEDTAVLEVNTNGTCTFTLSWALTDEPSVMQGTWTDAGNTMNLTLENKQTTAFVNSDGKLEFELETAEGQDGIHFVFVKGTSAGGNTPGGSTTPEETEKLGVYYLTRMTLQQNGSTYNYGLGEVIEGVCLTETTFALELQAHHQAVWVAYEGGEDVTRYEGTWSLEGTNIYFVDEYDDTFVFAVNGRELTLSQGSFTVVLQQGKGNLDGVGTPPTQDVGKVEEFYGIYYFESQKSDSESDNFVVGDIVNGEEITSESFIFVFNPDGQAVYIAAEGENVNQQIGTWSYDEKTEGITIALDGGITWTAHYSAGTLIVVISEDPIIEQVFLHSKMENPDDPSQPPQQEEEIFGAYTFLARESDDDSFSCSLGEVWNGREVTSDFATIHFNADGTVLYVQNVGYYREQEGTWERVDEYTFIFNMVGERTWQVTCSDGRLYIVQSEADPYMLLIVTNGNESSPIEPPAEGAWEGRYLFYMQSGEDADSQITVGDEIDGFIVSNQLYRVNLYDDGTFSFEQQSLNGEVTSCAYGNWTKIDNNEEFNVRLTTGTQGSTWYGYVGLGTLLLIINENPITVLTLIEQSIYPTIDAPVETTPEWVGVYEFSAQKSSVGKDNFVVGGEYNGEIITEDYYTLTVYEEGGFYLAPNGVGNREYVSGYWVETESERYALSFTVLREDGSTEVWNVSFTKGNLIIEISADPYYALSFVIQDAQEGSPNDPVSPPVDTTPENGNDSTAEEKAQLLGTYYLHVITLKESEGVYTYEAGVEANGRLYTATSYALELQADDRAVWVCNEGGETLSRYEGTWRLWEGEVFFEGYTSELAFTVSGEALTAVSSGIAVRMILQKGEGNLNGVGNDNPVNPDNTVNPDVNDLLGTYYFYQYRIATETGRVELYGVGDEMEGVVLTETFFAIELKANGVAIQVFDEGYGVGRLEYEWQIEQGQVLLSSDEYGVMVCRFEGKELWVDQSPKVDFSSAIILRLGAGTLDGVGNDNPDNPNNPVTPDNGTVTEEMKVLVGTYFFYEYHERTADGAEYVYRVGDEMDGVKMTALDFAVELRGNGIAIVVTADEGDFYREEFFWRVQEGYVLLIINGQVEMSLEFFEEQERLTLNEIEDGEHLEVIFQKGEGNLDGVGATDAEMQAKLVGTYYLSVVVLQEGEKYVTYMAGMEQNGRLFSETSFALELKANNQAVLLANEGGETSTRYESSWQYSSGQVWVDYSLNDGREERIIFTVSDNKLTTQKNQIAERLILEKGEGNLDGLGVPPQGNDGGSENGTVTPPTVDGVSSYVGQYVSTSQIVFQQN